MIIKLIYNIWTLLYTILIIFKHTFHKRKTLRYPEDSVYLAPRYKGRIILTNDPDGEERCVGCNLCAVVCPVSCISLQKSEKKDGRWYSKFFRINFSRCIFCGLCEEACPTSAIQLIPDFEMGEYNRKHLIYEKENLLISGPGKDYNYNFYKVTGISINKKNKGNAENETKPINVKSIMP
ncbi:NADH-quinone oxidoreductase subunit I [Candidatus Johnevansia muelleri]|uniref:NADH-quinone oxidoreductase subunit I n=1 Tax=Candidatus Johnevansia muelleri TaxID=1495769 RepID=A0A078KI05_9GAMM|nr:NADH-quinone oxidoreductase subunit I [Candidatus Evansia muelleri]